ncbi:MAG: AMP-binding protein [Myxococcales bacterium]|nr:AMP-binding protein [Myxococcales bacterium]
MNIELQVGLRGGGLDALAAGIGEPGVVVALDGLDADSPHSVVTRRELWRMSGEWCRRFREESRLEQGQAVGIALEDPADFAAALLAALSLRVRAVLLPDARPSTLSSAAARVDGWALYGEAPAAHGSKRLGPNVALEVFTSGSTGEPTCYPKALAELEMEIGAIENTFGNSTHDALIRSTVTHQHMYGLAFGILWPLCTGRPFSLRRASLWSLSHSPTVGGAPRRPTVVVTSPAHLNRLPERQGDVVAPALILSAGSALSSAAAQRCAEVLGCIPTEIYGSSELGAFASRQEGPWRPLAGYGFRVDSEQQLWARRQGEFEMSPDLATTDGDGFRLLGRADRIVKVESTRVSLDHVERHACSASGVHAARAALLEAHRPERPRDQIGLVLVPSSSGIEAIARGGRGAFLNALRVHLAEELAGPSMPRLIRLVDAIPSDALGKSRMEDVTRCLEGTASGWPPGRLLHLRADSVERETAIPADLPAFEGHFSGHPVLPGVEQLQWALDLVRSTGDTRPVSAMTAVKFKAIVRPGDVLLLGVRRLTEMRWEFEFRRGSQVVSTGRFELGAEGDVSP